MKPRPWIIATVLAISIGAVYGRALKQIEDWLRQYQAQRRGGAGGSSPQPSAK